MEENSKLISEIDRTSGQVGAYIDNVVSKVEKSSTVMKETSALLSSQYRPPSAFYYRVDFLGFPNPFGFGFQEVDGISASMEVKTQPEGGVNTYNRRSLGKIQYDNLTLKRGAANFASPLVAWVRATLEMGVNGKILPQPINVSLLDENGLPIMVWSFIDAIPVKWSMGPLDSMGDGNVLIETLELSYLYFTRML